MAIKTSGKQKAIKRAERKLRKVKKMEKQAKVVLLAENRYNVMSTNP